jgi:hypothetical protein
LFQLPSGKWYFFHESSQIYGRQFKHHTEQVNDRSRMSLREIRADR